MRWFYFLPEISLEKLCNVFNVLQNLIVTPFSSATLLLQILNLRGVEAPPRCLSFACPAPPHPAPPCSLSRTSRELQFPLADLYLSYSLPQTTLLQRAGRAIAIPVAFLRRIRSAEFSFLLALLRHIPSMELPFFLTCYLTLICWAVVDIFAYFLLEP